MVRGTLSLAAWLLVLGLVTTGVHLLGTGPLAVPPTTPAGFASWLASSDPLIATMAVLRLVLLAGCWYLIAATVLGTLVRIGHVARLVRIADAASPRFVQRFLVRSLGLSVATAMVTAGLPSVAGIATDERGVVTATVGDDGIGSAGDDLLAAPDAHPGPLPLQLLRAVPSPVAPSPAPSAAVSAETSDGAAATHLVVPGDSFWRIAVEATTAAWGREPTDREVVGYWRAVVEVNRGRLVDPHDPDLILPGQRFELPAVPPRPS